MARKGVYRRVRIPLLVLLWAAAIWAWVARWPVSGPLDKCPNTHGEGVLESHSGQLVLHITGSPRELGEQHGSLLKKSIHHMLEGYVDDLVCHGDMERRERLLGCVRRMKPSLPEWYLDELAACAQAADVDEDVLLLAQCEGCIRDVCMGKTADSEACTGYAVFGKPELGNGAMRVGRNLDYMSGEFARRCALVMYVTPAEGEGHAFVAVGWTGILGGWTLVNEWGLTLACHVGGGPELNPRGLPALVLLRLMAQKARDIDEALSILRSVPRMRGQIIWMAQPGDKATGRAPRAVAAEFDAEELYVREAEDGLLVVTNTNMVFGRKEGEAREGRPDSRYRTLRDAVAEATDDDGHLITAVANEATVHSVEIDFPRGLLHVAHGHLPAQDGPFVEHALPGAEQE